MDNTALGYWSSGARLVNPFPQLSSLLTELIDHILSKLGASPCRRRGPLERRAQRAVGSHGIDKFTGVLDESAPPGRSLQIATRVYPYIRVSEYVYILYTPYLCWYFSGLSKYEEVFGECSLFKNNK